jgi:hypothetical protein
MESDKSLTRPAPAWEGGLTREPPRKGTLLLAGIRSPLTFSTAVSVLLVALAATIFVPSASAREGIESEVELIDWAVVDGDLFANGLIHSENEKCVRNRPVRVVIRNNVDATIHRDTGRSSERGAWAVYGDLEGAYYAHVLALRKKLRNGDVCTKQGSENIYPFGP